MKREKKEQVKNAAEVARDTQETTTTNEVQEEEPQSTHSKL